jgi:hypothetical protein
MPPIRRLALRITTFAALGVILACNLFSPETTGPAATATYIVRATALMATLRSMPTPNTPLTMQSTDTRAASSTDTSLPPTDTPLPTDTPQPTETQTPTATETVVHLVTPGEPTGTTRYLTDPESKDYAAEQRAPSGSDNFTANRYERPFTAQEMAYLSDVDITRAELRIAFPWVYFTISVAGPRAEGVGETMYGVEIDRNKDGRGDFLVWGASPAGGVWTTDGVEVWKDSNGDVGGLSPQVAEAGGGNGYDEQVFASGQGADPDLAWIRQLSGGSKIQLALKASVLGGATSYLWSAVVDLGVRRPDWFDYNDHFTPAEAGSPLKTQMDLYPLKALFGVDNTCRDAFGYLPTGDEAGLCQLFGSISGTLCWDIDHDGACSATELESAAIGGDAINLGQGECPSSGFRTATTGSSGGYFFGELPAGKYCLGYTHVPAPGFLINPNPMTITLRPGEVKAVNLSIPW